MTRTAVLATALTKLVGVRVPVVQTGMGWVSGASLTAATARAGGLGIIAGATLGHDAMLATVDAVRSATDAAFGVNLRPDQVDLDVRIGAVLDRGVSVVSFAGAPKPPVVDRVHRGGGVVVVTVGARRHAVKVLDAGVDAVIAQGAEGGGHTGYVPTSILLPDVIEAVGDHIPVIAAGGYRNGAGLASALAAGAAGVAMGTRFLLTKDSPVPDHVKQRYLAAGPRDTVVTTALDGAPQRVICTDVVRRLEASNRVRRLPGALRAAASFRRVADVSWLDLVREGWAMRSDERSLSDVALAAFTPTLTRAALVDGDLAAGVLPTGQVVGVLDDLPTVADLLDGIVRDAVRHLAGKDTTGGVT